MEDYPVYRFKVKEEGTGTGMVGISLVDDPAVMSNWQAFANVKEQPTLVALKNEDGEYKQELMGAALRPDILILRKDEGGGYYYGVFEKETIEIIRNKFHKEKNTSNVNLMHDGDKKVDAYLIESFIIQNEEQLNATKSLGIEDIEVGTWMVKYKVESEEVFQQALDGNLNGFSIEVLLERELMESFKNNNKNNLQIMSEKLKNLISKFKSALSEFEEEPNTDVKSEFEDVKVADGEDVLRYTSVGQPVNVVTTDAEGAETEVIATEGEYILEDGRTLVIDADGNLTEIKDAAEEVEPIAEEELTEEPVKETKEEAPAEATEEEAPAEKTDLDKTIRELIPTDANGTYQLEVYVDGGSISFGTLYAYTYNDLKLANLVEEFESMKIEKENLAAEVVTLKAEVEKPVTKAVFTEISEKKHKGEEKVEFKNNLEYQLNRLGLDKE